MTERFRKDTLMSMMNTGDILETIEMFTQDNLDVRTVTMGISLLDCIDPDPKKACEKIYNKITTKAADLVPAVEHISAEYGIPIINKRISVTPIAMLLGACPDADPVDFAKALDAAGKKVGVNFVGGYTALVHKGGVAAHKVHAHLFACGIQCLGKVHGVCIGAGTQQHGNGGDADPLVDDGNAVLGADMLHGGHQIGCLGGDLVVNLFAGLLRVRINAVQQADAHGDRAHVQIVLREHLDGLEDVAGIHHAHKSILSKPLRHCFAMPPLLRELAQSV